MAYSNVENSRLAWLSSLRTGIDPSEDTKFKRKVRSSTHESRFCSIPYFPVSFFNWAFRPVDGDHRYDR